MGPLSVKTYCGQVCRFVAVKSRATRVQRPMELIEPPVDLKNLVLCISIKANDSQSKMAAFNAGLRQISQDATMAKILKGHGF